MRKLVCVLVIAVAVLSAAQNVPSQTPSPAATPPDQSGGKLPPREHAWKILRAGAEHKSVDRRSKSIGVLGLIPHNQEARRLAETALKDEDAGVRIAAATALGEMGSKPSIPLLKVCLDDPETRVVLTCAKALLQLHDDAGYDVYYEVLTGKRKARGSMLKEQMRVLHDPKKLAAIGLDEGLGFVPFAGMGYTALKLLAKDEVSPVRAAAARALASDSDPDSGKALADVAADKSWIVRTAALDAIAKRGDAQLLPAAVGALDDEKEIVMYTAAAAIVHLTDPPAMSRKRSAVPTKKQ